MAQRERIISKIIRVLQKMILIGNHITSNIYAVKSIRAARGIGKLAPLLCFKVKYVQLTEKTDFIHPIYWTFMFRLLTFKPCIRCLSRQKNQTKRKSNRNKLERKKRKKERKKTRQIWRQACCYLLLVVPH